MFANWQNHCMASSKPQGPRIAENELMLKGLKIQWQILAYLCT